MSGSSNRGTSATCGTSLLSLWYLKVFGNTKKRNMYLCGSGILWDSGGGGGRGARNEIGAPFPDFFSKEPKMVHPKQIKLIFKSKKKQSYPPPKKRSSVPFLLFSTSTKLYTRFMTYFELLFNFSMIFDKYMPNG